MHRRVLVLVLALITGPGVTTASAGERERDDVRRFAQVPDPGSPEGIAVDPRRGRVYVGTNPLTGPASKLFAFDRRGRLRRSWTIRGQRVDRAHGLYGLALDGRGRVYAADFDPARVLVLDPRTSRQRTFAKLPDIAPVDGRPDRPPWPNALAFARDGSLFVTDSAQATVWRVPRRGGRPRAWLTDPRLGGAEVGANGVALARGGRALLVAWSNFPAADGRGGRLLSIPVGTRGRAGRPRTLFTSAPGEVPDGLAVARSGRIYLALAAANAVAVLSPDGRLLRRVTSADPPMDNPASLAFDGRRLLVTNLSLFGRIEANFAVLDLFAGERGSGLTRP